MGSFVEIIDFARPDGSRKNLFITGIPGSLAEDKIVFELRKIFDVYGLVYGVQVFPCQWTGKSVTNTESESGKISGGYYAFVTFYSAAAAGQAKQGLNSSVLLGDEECKISYAKSKRETAEKHQLYFTRCYELINFYLGFNSWSTSIKTIFEDKDDSSSDQERVVKFVCLIELSVLDLKTDGVGVWQEAVLSNDPLCRIQATAKCKKFCHMRAVENAFSKVLLIVLGNSKVAVEIDTTRPEFRSDVIPEEQLIKVSEIEAAPESELEDQETVVKGDNFSLTDDDINVHILKDLEEDM